jgi:inner membrane protein involved in colicin E2 resistance
MERSLGLKLGAIVLLMMLLLAGLLWIGSVVTERQARRTTSDKPRLRWGLRTFAE